MESDEGGVVVGVVADDDDDDAFLPAGKMSAADMVLECLLGTARMVGLLCRAALSDPSEGGSVSLTLDTELLWGTWPEGVSGCILMVPSLIDEGILRSPMLSLNLFVN